MPTDNEVFRDFSLVRQTQVLRASESETRVLLAAYRDADEELTQMLLRVRDPGSLTASRLRAVQANIREALEAQHAIVSSGIRAAMAETAATEAEAALGVLNRILVPVGLDTTTPRAAAILAASRSTPYEGKIASQWISQLHAGDLARVQQAVVRGVTIGQTTDEMVRSVVGSPALRYRDGTREVSRRGLRTLVRTSMIHASTQAREASWAENADFIEGERWISTLDGRTSPICQSLDGQIFPVGEGPRPPAHFNCRSTMTPILKGEAELGLPPGTRASLDGQVPGDLTYEEWLRGRSAAFQDDVLGPTKGKLFREGGVSLDRFVSTTGKPFTIAQLRSATPSAFREVGLNPTGPIAAFKISKPHARGLGSLAKIKDVPDAEKFFDFDAGKEISSRSIWPIDERRKSGFNILGIKRDSEGFKNTVLVDPKDLAPSQPGMIRSAVQRYIAEEDPSKIKGLGSGGIRVGYIDGLGYIQAGHHRLAAAVLRGNTSATVEAFYYTQNASGKLKQVSIKEYLKTNPSPSLDD